MQGVERQAEALWSAREARTAAKAPPNVLAGAFDKQLAYIHDTSPFKAEFCTRRAAKSYTVGLEYLDDAQRHPRAHYLFLMTVRAQAKRDFWEDVLKDIDLRYSLGIEFNESELVATLPNRAKLYIGGADSSSQEWRKLIAGKYRKVHIDEAQAFVHSDLKTLVYEAFKPAVADHRGSVGLSGTPGTLSKGLFFDVTHGTAPGWSVHRWSALDNPYIRDNWRAEIDELKRTHPGIEETPSFRRNYLGEWVVEDSALVYRYSSPRNDYRDLPRFARGSWRYVLGCDLGHEDATAWVVCAWHEHEKTLFVLEVHKEKGLDITAVARRTEALRSKYDFDVLVVDGANKQAVAEMRNRHGIPWEAADKTGKEDFIELMNGDFILGRIKLAPEATPLADEYRSLIWDEKKLRELGKREEHRACDNHAADAALYSWRYCLQYLSEKPVQGPETKIQQYQEPDALEEAEVARFEDMKRHEAGEVGAWDESWRWR